MLKQQGLFNKTPQKNSLKQHKRKDDKGMMKDD